MLKTILGGYKFNKLWLVENEWVLNVVHVDDFEWYIWNMVCNIIFGGCNSLLCLC